MNCIIYKPRFPREHIRIYVFIHVRAELQVRDGRFGMINLLQYNYSSIPVGGAIIGSIRRSGAAID